MHGGRGRVLDASVLRSPSLDSAAARCDVMRPSVLYLVTEPWYFANHRLDHARALMADGFEVHVATRFGDRWQELSGRLIDSAGAGVSDYVVMVFPVNEAYWMSGSRRIVIAQPGTDGRFAIGGSGPALLPAGEYFLAAVTDVSKDEQYDAAFLQSLISASIRVTLRSGEKTNQDLRVR